MGQQGEPMWKTVFRKGIMPLFTKNQLAALHIGLVTDDPRLIQGATTSPLPLQCVQDWPCEGGCLIAFPIAFEDNDNPLKIGETEEAFAKICFQCDQIMAEPVAVRHLLNAYDEWPREVMRREMLALLNEEEVRPQYVFAVKK